MHSYWWITKSRWDKEKRQYVDRTTIMRVSEGQLEQIGIERLRKWLAIASDKGESHLWALDKASQEAQREKESGNRGANIKDISCYGGLYVFYQVAKHVYGKHRFKSPLWDLILLMISSRLRFPGSSKLKISRLWERERALWEAVGISTKADVDKLYRALDWLNERWSRIVKGHSKSYGMKLLLLFDVTSLWLEGESIVLGKFGYSRDGKQGKRQIIVGIIAGDGGYGIDVEMFTGNTSDVEVFRRWVKEQANKYQLEEVVLIGDGAMLPPVEQKRLSQEGIKFIGRMSITQVNKLLREKNVKLDLWDSKIQEVELDNGERVVLTLSEVRREREWRTLLRRLRRIHEALRRVRQKVLKGHLTKAEEIWKEVGEAMGRRHHKSMFIIEVQDGYMDYRLDRRRLAPKVKYLGIWALKTNVENRSGEQIRDDYKLLYYVERSFRYLKTVLINMRPVYHRLTDRIRAHIRLSVMTLNVFLFLNQCWEGILETYNTGNGRKYKLTLLEALELMDRVKIIAYDNDEPDQSYKVFVPVQEKLIAELLSALPVKIIR